MIIDCISDLHGHYPKLEGGNLLIIAGDLTDRDTPECHMKFGAWLMENGNRYKQAIVIAGNHDNFCEKHNKEMKDWGSGYLCDSGTEFEGLKIWGSPWTIKFPGMNPKCMAFTCDTEEELAEKWALIPDNVDILITHGPPHGMRDGEGPWQHLGSSSLIDRILNLSNLKIHVFGHIHEAYGFSDRGNHQLKKESEYARFINCSHVNERYQPVNKPIRVIL